MLNWPDRMPASAYPASQVGLYQFASRGCRCHARNVLRPVGDISEALKSLSAGRSALRPRLAALDYQS